MRVSRTSPRNYRTLRGSRLYGTEEEIKNEILKEFREWHDTYVPDHKYDSDHDNDPLISGYIRHIHINHGPELEKSIDAVKKAIGKNESIRSKYSTRYLAIKLLENDKETEEKEISSLPNHAEIIRLRDKENQRIRSIMNEDCEQAITDAKYGFISGAMKET